MSLTFSCTLISPCQRLASNSYARSMRSLAFGVRSDSSPPRHQIASIGRLSSPATRSFRCCSLSIWVSPKNLNARVEQTGQQLHQQNDSHEAQAIDQQNHHEYSLLYQPHTNNCV